MSPEQSSPTVRPGNRYTGAVLPLPEPVARELQDWRASFGDAQAGAVAPHVTLLISPRAPGWSDVLRRVQDAVAEHEPFHLEIDGTGTFRPVTPVVYLRIRRGYEQCLALHRALLAQGLVSASPFDYRPHVTLAQGLGEQDLDRAQQALRTFRAGFLVDRVHLYSGDERGVWRMAGSLPLGPHAAGDHDRC